MQGFLGGRHAGKRKAGLQGVPPALARIAERIVTCMSPLHSGAA
jgi:hypothetical protein